MPMRYTPRYTMGSFVAILCLCAVAAGFAQAPKKPTVAIMDFTGSFRQFTKDDLSAITSRFETELMKTGQFQVLERRNIDAILQEQGFQQTGACNTSECQVQVGQLLGVESFIAGEVSQVGKVISLNLKMVDVGSGANQKSHALDIEGDLQTVLSGGCYEMAQIFAGLKQPAAERTVLTAQKSSPWPWILGGAALVTTGVVTYILLTQDQGAEDRTVDTGF